MSARGRVAVLHALLTGKIEPSAGVVEKVFGCLQCGACARNCPSGINVPELIYAGRWYLRSRNGGDVALRVIAKYVLRYPGPAFKIARFPGTPFGGYLKRTGLLPARFNMPDRTLKDSMPEIHASGTKGRVAIFTGCGINFLFPDLGRALIQVLAGLGYEVILPKGEVCCGVPFRALGMEREARDFARRNIRVFGKIKADAVISLCPTCILALKKEYPLMVGSGVETAMDISSFLTEYEDDIFKNRLNTKGVYHDPCHMLHGLNIRREPRDVLKKCGVDLIDTVPPGCCGFGGTHSIKFREESLRIAQTRRDALEASSAREVFTSCPGCRLQLRKVTGRSKVLHIIEAIERAVG